MLMIIIITTIIIIIIMIIIIIVVIFKVMQFSHFLNEEMQEVKTRDKERKRKRGREGGRKGYETEKKRKEDEKVLKVGWNEKIKY